MFSTFFLKIIGFLLSRVPRPLLSCLIYILGNAIYYGLPKRRRLAYSNMYHSVSGKTHSWYRKQVHVICRRVVELGLFSFASGFLSKRYIKKYFKLDPTSLASWAKVISLEKPILLLLPHTCLFEACNFIAVLLPKIKKEIGIIYRPLNQKILDAYVQSSRSRFGFKLIPRKNGAYHAIKILKNNGAVVVLFDQHAGAKGYLNLFLNQIAASTPLPDFLVQKTQAVAYMLYAERTGIWAGTIHLKQLVRTSLDNPIILDAQAWLEDKIKSSERFCQEWLWLHNRWKAHTDAHTCLNVDSKHNYLKHSLEHYKITNVPKTKVLYIRLPNWLGDIIMTLPLLRAIKDSRPDLFITCFVKPKFRALVELFECVDVVTSIEGTGFSYLKKFWRLRKQYPHVYVLFTNSVRSDLEAFLTGAPLRLGIKRPQYKRWLLTHVWKAPNYNQEQAMHQTHLWEHFLKNFGLVGSLDLSPLNYTSILNNKSKYPIIGLICGTENSPEKRWPIASWQALIRDTISYYPDVKIYLFGTQADACITQEICNINKSSNIVDLAGKTSLIGLIDELVQCSVVIGNDTGGLHLANALGISVIGLYGPTNPVRTQPIFAAPKTIIQPKGCPEIGGMPMIDITVQMVLDQLKLYLEH